MNEVSDKYIANVQQAAWEYQEARRRYGTARTQLESAASDLQIASDNLAKHCRAVLNVLDAGSEGEQP